MATGSKGAERQSLLSWRSTRRWSAPAEDNPCWRQLPHSHTAMPLSRDGVIVQLALAGAPSKVVEQMLALHPPWAIKARRIRAIASSFGVPFDEHAVVGGVRRRPPLSQFAIDALVYVHVEQGRLLRGYRAVQSALQARLPDCTIGRDRVQRALLRLYPEAVAARDTHITRQVKDGIFRAPYVGYLWQSDLCETCCRTLGTQTLSSLTSITSVGMSIRACRNLNLSKWGLGVGAVVDVHSRTVYALVPITTKLMAIVWEQVNMVAVLRAGGFPDKWTTGVCSPVQEATRRWLSLCCTGVPSRR